MPHFLLLGDINLLGVTNPEEPLGRVASVLHEAGAVFANLECMLAKPSASHSLENEGFYADPVVGAAVLKHGGISGVGIANNINYGGPSIVNSIAALDAGKIPHTGGGANLEAARLPVIVEKAGVTYGMLQRTSVYWPTDHAADAKAAGVAVLPGHTAYEAPMYRYHAGIPPVNRPGIPPIVLTWADTTYLSSYTSDIELLRPKVDIVIASVHWGLGREVLTYMEQIAHASIDAGADVVMGHGPHHPLAIAFYKGKPIFYGLGSFSFHMGHLGMAHGNWIGLVARVEDAKSSAQVSFKMARHNEKNETFFSDPSEESVFIESLAKASKPYGATLKVDGDRVLVLPA